ncbi:hypothetical protein TURU_050977 [Turdus rufiventris]|nr:hypothetical protein TURU_050977 [Turdus rufiventris]
MTESCGLGKTSQIIESQRVPSSTNTFATKPCPQTLPQLRCPSRDLLWHLNVLPELRAQNWTRDSSSGYFMFPCSLEHLDIAMKGHQAMALSLFLKWDESSRNVWLFDPEEKRFRGDLIALYSSMRGDCGQVEISLCSQVARDRMRENGLKLH